MRPRKDMPWAHETLPKKKLRRVSQGRSRTVGPALIAPSSGRLLGSRHDLQQGAAFARQARQVFAEERSEATGPTLNDPTLANDTVRRWLAQPRIGAGSQYASNGCARDRSVMTPSSHSLAHWDGAENGAQGQPQDRKLTARHDGANMAFPNGIESWPYGATNGCSAGDDPV